MESTVSVSKGVFLFPSAFKKPKNSKQKTSLLEKQFRKEQWYKAYKKNWDKIESRIMDLHQKTYDVLLNDMVNYIKSFYGGNESLTLEGVIPSATLLTGVNQPDHVSQFETLISKIRDEVTPHIAMVNSQDASSIKNLVENVVWQLVNGNEIMDDSADSDDETLPTKKKLKKNQCTMRVLQNWYNSKYLSNSPKKRHSVSIRSLVIIIPDFESFNCSVLQDFVMIISSYLSSLPIVFVFGVATSVSALHKSFPYHVSSKLLIKVFHSHSSPVYMNQVLEDIFLNHSSPLHLSGKAFELLTDVFLFYDFSVTGLIQSIKYCMMEHYYGDNVKSLCCERDEIEDAAATLSADDIESIRQLPSFRPFLEAQDCETKIGLFEDDNFFREVLCQELNKLHDYLHSYYLCVRLLAAFLKDLPKNIIGKTVREIYTKCAGESITRTPTFKECMQLINFQSQLKLLDSIQGALKVVNTELNTVSPVKPLRSSPIKNNTNKLELNNELGESFAKTVRVHLLTFLRHLENANTEVVVLSNVVNETENEMEVVPGNRYKLKEQLLRATRADRIQSEFEMIRSRFVSYLEDMFSKGLQPPTTQTFHEVIFFSDVSSVRKQIVGSPRGAVHTALSNPYHYLQCSCCRLSSSESASATLPDVCLAYKLHRECGKHINLYDWLQAFVAVLCPGDEAEGDAMTQVINQIRPTSKKGQVAYWLQAVVAVLCLSDEGEWDAQTQARFTRAVAELQFLGFIKSSKRKTDHVMRLTW